MSEPLTHEEERTCLKLARQALEHYFKTGSVLRSPVKSGTLKEKRGAFVTLHIDGELRGCIGYPLPVKPLDETIIAMALAAATEDPRFEPVAANELNKIKIEISVLGLPEPVKDPGQVQVGCHGIIVSKGPYKGLLLPQVPTEYGWDRETYLSHGCLKAGLAPDEWKKGAKLEVFTAQVFSE